MFSFPGNRLLGSLPSKRLIISYLVDWVVIIVIAAVGAGLSTISPYKRPFSLVDLSISYPYVQIQIPTWLLFVISVVAPAVIIFIVCIAFIPGLGIKRNVPRHLIWRKTLWEWNTGWMGLGLSLAIAFIFTQGMKNLFGKPRPDLLNRCRPDLNRIGENRISLFASGFDAQWALVGPTICTNTDQDLIDDGFRSFPSGHASAVWSGLFYLALFLCSKFAIAVPFLPPISSKPRSYYDPDDPFQDQTGGESEVRAVEAAYSRPNLSNYANHNRAAAPPLYLLAVPLIPIGAASYVTASRYFQYQHDGFDILFGSMMGILTSWVSFRLYHPPISRGAGWAWGARSRSRAWGIGIGMGGYVGTEGWGSAKSVRKLDEEAGGNAGGATKPLGRATPPGGAGQYLEAEDLNRGQAHQ